MQLPSDFGEMFANRVMRRKQILNTKCKKENCKSVTQEARNVLPCFLYPYLPCKLSAPLLTADGCRDFRSSFTEIPKVVTELTVFLTYSY